MNEYAYKVTIPCAVCGGVGRNYRCVACDGTGVRAVQISHAMSQAIGVAEAYRGVLRRIPGRKWYGLFSYVDPVTVQALVDRGVMEYCAWETNALGQDHAIEVRLKK